MKINPVVFQRLHVQKIPCDRSWTIPDNGRWGSGYGTEDAPQYDTYDNSKNHFADKWERERPGWDRNEKGVIKRWFTFETIETGAEIIDTERYYTKSIYSDERKRKDAIAQAINNSKLFSGTWSHYDIDKLEKVLNISLK